jgi:hypothetical protein
MKLHDLEFGIPGNDFGTAAEGFRSGDEEFQIQSPMSVA